MDKYDFEKKLEKLSETLLELGEIHEEMNFLRSRLDDAIYELEVIKSHLEAFGDELDEEKEND